MSLRTILIACTIYYVTIPLFSVAQTSQLFGSEVKIHRGFVMMHREGVQHLVEGPVGIVQLNLFYTPNGTKDWHHYTRFANVGLSIMQVNTGSEQLGIAYGFLPYMRLFPYRSKLVDWTGQFGIGMGYFTKRWSRVEQRKNEMIGSHINIAVSLQTELLWHITPSVDFITGLAFTHFSNAGTQKPNLGINVPSASIGVRYTLNRGLSPKEITDTTAVNHQREIILLGAGFVNQFDVLMDKQLATTFSVEYGSFSSNRRSRLHGALDIFYNGELGDFYENEGFDYSTIDLFQVGVSGGYSRFVGKLSVYLGMGVYVYAYELPSLSIYNRVGLRYRATERFIVNEP